MDRRHDVRWAPVVGQREWCESERWPEATRLSGASDSQEESNTGH